MELEATFTEGVEAIRTPEGIRNDLTTESTSFFGLSRCFGLDIVEQTPTPAVLDIECTLYPGSGKVILSTGDTCKQVLQAVQVACACIREDIMSNHDIHLRLPATHALIKEEKQFTTAVAVALASAWKKKTMKPQVAVSFCSSNAPLTRRMQEGARTLGLKELLVPWEILGELILSDPVSSEETVDLVGVKDITEAIEKALMPDMQGLSPVALFSSTIMEKTAESCAHDSVSNIENNGVKRRTDLPPEDWEPVAKKCRAECYLTPFEEPKDENQILSPTKEESAMVAKSLKIICGGHDEDFPVDKKLEAASYLMKWSSKFNHLVLTDFLGAGNNGSVFEVMESSTKECYAMKLCKKGKSFEREMKRIQKISAKKVSALFVNFRAVDRFSVGCAGYLMDKMEGTLLDLLRHCIRLRDEGQSIVFSDDILAHMKDFGCETVSRCMKRWPAYVAYEGIRKVLKGLEEEGVVHGDLHDENILYSKECLTRILEKEEKGGSRFQGLFRIIDPAKTAFFRSSNRESEACRIEDLVGLVGSLWTAIKEAGEGSRSSWDSSICRQLFLLSLCLTRDVVKKLDSEHQIIRSVGVAASLWVIGEVDVPLQETLSFLVEMDKDGDESMRDELLLYVQEAYGQCQGKDSSSFAVEIQEKQGLLALLLEILKQEEPLSILPSKTASLVLNLMESAFVCFHERMV